MEAIRDSKNRIKKIVLFESELSKTTGLTHEELKKWEDVFQHVDYGHKDEIGGVEKKYEFTLDELKKAQKKAILLKTGMTPKQLPEIEARGFLDAYALLANDCPPNVTPHMLRSYCVLIVYQNRANVMLTAETLAEKAQIPEDAARRHIMYLTSVGLLKMSQDPTRWEFDFVPKALNRFFPG